MPMFKKVRSRILKYFSIKDEHLHQVEDNSRGKDGDDTQGRAHARTVFSKTITLEDGRVLPMFMLAEAPEVFSPEDPFDRELLVDRSTGKWLQPTREWLEERARRIEKKRDRAETARIAVENQTARDVLKGLAELIKGGAGFGLGTAPAPKELDEGVTAILARLDAQDVELRKLRDHNASLSAQLAKVKEGQRERAREEAKGDTKKDEVKS